MDKLLNLLTKLLNPNVPKKEKGKQKKGGKKEKEKEKEGEEAEKAAEEASKDAAQGSPDDPLPEVPYKIVVLCESCSVRVPQTRGNAAETIEQVRKRRVCLSLNEFLPPRT